MKLVFAWMMLSLQLMAYGQHDFLIGSASKSIEPGSSMVSAALAGYGVPREGRFSMSWEPAPEMDRSRIESARPTKLEGNAKRNIVSVTKEGQQYYALDTGSTIWLVRPALGDNAWTMIGRYNGATFKDRLLRIAMVDHQLYALNDQHEVLRASHRSKGDLAVNTLAISNGKENVVIIGADLCGFDGSFVTELKETLSQKHRLPPAAVLINASHTHFAPVSQSWKTWAKCYQVPDTNYLYGVVKERVLASVDEALKAMQPAGLWFSRGQTDIGVNRRSTAVKERPYDPTLDVLKVVDEDGKMVNVLFSAGCHPVFENKGEESFTISANYPGVARKAVIGHRQVPHALFLQGCGGDINPKDKSYERTGQLLARDVMDLLSGPMQALESDISFYLDTIEIPVKPWSLERVQAFKAQNQRIGEDIEAEKNVRWANLMIERYKKGGLKDYLPIYVQTINIGQWKLVGLSREAVNEYGPAIRSLWPDKFVTVLGYSNDVSSYLPTDWHIESGVYEGFGSFFWYGQPGLPPSDILNKIVGGIKDRKR